MDFYFELTVAEACTCEHGYVYLKEATFQVEFSSMMWRVGGWGHMNEQWVGVGEDRPMVIVSKKGTMKSECIPLLSCLIHFQT